jgi:vacuole morphology and inheritance protein 14
MQDPLDSSAITASASNLSTVSRTSTHPAATLASISPGIKAKLPSFSEPATPLSLDFTSKGRASVRPDSPGQAQIATGAAGQSQGKDPQPMSPVADTILDDDPFDVRETVNVLTLQFLSDHAETRIAALEWLLMLHLKAPNKVSRWLWIKLQTEQTDLV